MLPIGTHVFPYKKFSQFGPNVMLTYLYNIKQDIHICLLKGTNGINGTTCYL